ncbi:two-component system sensor histidine kinase KdpD [Caldanaerobacter subterraneus subsp. tengcongensis MB4]|uniref:Osmosensitive K+ channel His kinase sensor domain protein n=2 Tax=Caldanaerobacter subterraneus TaxID=911092 RepID=Q8R869_CALS4|nr:universal stress protein [Caldanaerobacter subterraneus]AAM25317.1 Osmosensitive K+ channel His kinase sensor domain protein [Caldanaerobacter subterraneus subsp. tengcongensis MB4]KKC29054.1 osmosensitive K+ channel histidine kinase sensor subunit [Caldanaerobacter subterraneus subsp. pacificus DSM 12653]MCS3915081.1 two-component system sensor histidine kinase KdpD [Caldanaerobacter subterraneus subsp. tengcongensis MB4]
MSGGYRRLTPEEALEIVKKEQRGKLKIFLGYAPGVGKTYAMLNEGNRRLKRGQDVVIGYVETHGRKDTEAQIGNLEIIPRKKIEYHGMILEEMDVDAIIARKPEVVLIDELAHTNAPGSKHKKRYEDVQEILEHGINVLTTLNIQHIESLNDIIQQITGIAVRETVPDSIIDNADEIVAVDLTPDALINRLKRGDVYPLSKLDECLSNFFRKGNLSALRELMLRLTAEEVDLELEEYMKEHGIEDTWETNEKIMVCITPNPLSKKLIRRGARRARRFKCDWVVVYVDCTHFLAPKLTEKDKEVLESHFMLAKQLGAEVYTLRGKSVSDELLKFAKKMHITQIIIGHSQRSWLQTLFRGSTVIKLIKKAKNIEIHVIPYTK